MHHNKKEVVRDYPYFKRYIICLEDLGNAKKNLPLYRGRKMRQTGEN